MTELYRQYLLDLYRSVPTSVYEGLLSVLFLGIVALFAFKGFRKGWRGSAGIFLIVYVVFVYCSTVFFRPPSSEVVEYGFQLFGNYKAIIEGRSDLIPESVMNVIVFIPIGILVKISFHEVGIKIVLIIGLCLSLSIEVMQFFFDRGCADGGDVMNNTVGCLLGYSIYKMISRIMGEQAC